MSILPPLAVSGQISSGSSVYTVLKQVDPANGTSPILRERLACRFPISA